MLERGRSLARCPEGGFDGSRGARYRAVVGGSRGSRARLSTRSALSALAVWNVISHGDLDRVVGSQIVIGGN